MIKAYEYAGLIRVELDADAGDGVLLEAPHELDVQDPFSPYSAGARAWDDAVQDLWTAGFALLDDGMEPIGQRDGWTAYAVVPSEDAYAVQ